MASTTFIDNQTIIYAAWLNDVNNAIYNGNFPGTTYTFSNLVATNATITNLTASFSTLNLTNNWSIVAGPTKLSFINNGTTVASLDTSGNLKLLAASTTGTTP